MSYSLDYSSKIIAMTTFLLIDVVLNSIVDYNYYNYQVNLGLGGLEIVVQITIFLILFLGFSETYLFRVGLINYLLQNFLSVLIIHPIYFTITIIDVAYRLQLFRQGSSALILWQTNGFLAVSYIQKFSKFLKQQILCRLI